MTQEQLLEDIKSQGYWRVEIRSTEYQDRRLRGRSAMQNLLSNTMVSLRGWPYPYYRVEEITYTGKWLEGKVNWIDYNHREYWRLYESGQWIHYVALAGGWMTRERMFSGRSPLPPQHAGYLHVRGDILFSLTEIFRFAVGLAEGGILDPTAFLSIQLHNTGDYMLYESFDRFFTNRYVNPSERPFERQLSLPVSELPAIADQQALEMAVDIFEVFGWSPAESAMRNLTEDQKKLVERRLH